jgi:hypothetical protein
MFFEVKSFLILQVVFVLNNLVVYKFKGFPIVEIRENIGV